MRRQSTKEGRADALSFLNPWEPARLYCPTQLIVVVALFRIRFRPFRRFVLSLRIAIVPR
jgi:hypothetical protein